MLKGSSSQTRPLTILHVEDEPMLAELVRAALETLGFGGNILQADRVGKARDLLGTMARDHVPLDLILVDMKLPDGLGLDVIREVKTSPTWSRTPVIVLSAESDPSLINEAYALGANCFLPKQGKHRGFMGAIESLYQCWMEEAHLPQPLFTSQVKAALANAIRLRARAARFYLDLARTCTTDPEQEKFWIERSLSEGNKSNLLAFFQGQMDERDVPAVTAEKTIDMQRGIENALKTAEGFLAGPSSPSPAQMTPLLLDLLEASDEEVLAEAYGALFPKNPTVTMALKAQAAEQLKELAGFVLNQVRDSELRRRAEAQLAFAKRLRSWV